ncbi:hypothetical protein Tco_0922757 [Tanacetum coccineum]|uniref:Uncharacterized protein n=1 Tax=Tanacetum coccineum TaxID=301880 RepID=A0ABQ5D2C0_9ASTR
MIQWKQSDAEQSGRTTTASVEDTYEMVTDISLMDKINAKTDKTGHEIGRVQEIKAEGIFNFNEPTHTWIEDQGLIFNDLKNDFDQGSRFEYGG